jgi:hypothetical protein
MSFLVATPAAAAGTRSESQERFQLRTKFCSDSKILRCLCCRNRIGEASALAPAMIVPPRMPSRRSTREYLGNYREMIAAFYAMSAQARYL